VNNREISRRCAPARENSGWNRFFLKDEFMDDQQPLEPVRRRLGRGLSALLGSSAGGDLAPSENQADRSMIHVELIDRNPFQPRRDFDPTAITELADSIRQHGILQPLLVRQTGDGYQLVVGERRLIAAKKAGLELVPCQVLNLSDQQVCEVALEENLKRQDLNVMEKAQAFQDYMNRFQCTIEDVGRRFSLDRSTVSNLLRLFELPDPLQAALRNATLSAGHARALLPLPPEEQLKFAEMIQRNGLSVRKVEEMIRSRTARHADAPVEASAPGETPAVVKFSRTSHIDSLEQQLCEMLGVKVQIKLRKKDSGQIVIDFRSNDDFERILNFLRRAA
jgi:ParB family chromosome partitioning protein